ncbi:MAG: M24 family metallopeptidase [Elusimicrobium sp.]|jgi:Xaa-Pro aminopeptidase|nr:M24 family metallopeptidase [Elusimicrobium sp.]
MMTDVEIKKFLSLIKPYNGYVTSDVTDMRYFTGRAFNPTEKVFMLVRTAGITFFCGTISYDTLKAALPSAEIVLSAVKGNTAVIAEYIKKNKITGLAFDENKEFFAAGEILKAAGVQPAADVTAAARAIKTQTEIKFISRACNITYRAYKYVRPRIKTGMTEAAVARMLENFMMNAGAEKDAFGAIVAFGKNAASPHHTRGQTKLKAQDAVLLDFGCVCNGCYSDMTRSWWHGGGEPAEYKKIWKIVEAAQRAALKKIKTGLPAKEADKISRDIIAAAGYGNMVHSLGHGVGLNIHEAPSLSPRSEEILRADQVFTVEPGIYLPGKYGVRLEETVLLEKSCIKILTK